MLRRLSWAIPVIFFLAASSLLAQAQGEAWPRPNPIRSSEAASVPDQPVIPPNPTIQRRAGPDAARQYSPTGQAGNQSQPQLPKERQAFPLPQQNVASQQNAAPQQNAPQQPQQPPPPPFTLSPQEEAQLDRVLKAWEQKSKDIKTFDASFKRWEYDPVLAEYDRALAAKQNSDPEAAVNIDLGIVKYATPDKGVFQVLSTEGPDGKIKPIEPDRADHWICDGKSVYQYVPSRKQLVERKLPPEMQGKAIVDGPLPFLFGADSQKLRQRYWIRIVPPPPNNSNVVCLEAFPRYQQDAANFRAATLMLNVPEMTPNALQILQPNGKSHTSYIFYGVVFNDPLRFFQGNPFQPYTPRGWEKIVDDSAQQQAGRPGAKPR
jgi:TIGR03009 family protein